MKDLLEPILRFVMPSNKIGQIKVRQKKLGWIKIKIKDISLKTL